MRTLTTAVLSFILGAALASLYGSQTSTPQPPPQSSQRGTISTGRAPVVVPGIVASSHDADVTGMNIVLDGYSCVRCDFRDTTLMYGGGVYVLDHSKMEGTANVVLTGAAANTVAFLSNLGLGLCKLPTPMERPNPNRPITQVARFEQPVMIDLRSPYGQP